MEISDLEYARSGNLDIAYQRFGSGPDVIIVPGLVLRSPLPVCATWVSSTVRDLLLGGEWSFAERGEHVLKGIDRAWRLYELATPQSSLSEVRHDFLRGGHLGLERNPARRRRSVSRARQ